MARVNTKCGVYMIKNINSGRVYIGSSKSIEDRFYQHKWCLSRGEHHSSILQKSWDKHGEESFSFSVLLICSTDNLEMYEQLFIDFYDSSNKDIGYNICKIAGMPPKVFYTNEMRIKMSQSRLGKPIFKNNPEKYARLLEAAALRRGVNHHTYLKPMSDEVKKKISDSKKGKSNSMKGRPNLFAKGKPRSKDVIDKIKKTKASKPCPYAILNIDKVKEIRAIKNFTGISNKKISELYGVHSGTIADVVNFKNWNNLGGSLD